MIKHNDNKVTAKTMAIKILHDGMLAKLNYWKEDVFVKLEELTEKEIKDVEDALNKELEIFEKKHAKRIWD